MLEGSKDSVLRHLNATMLNGTVFVLLGIESQIENLLPCSSTAIPPDKLFATVF